MAANQHINLAWRMNIECDFENSSANQKFRVRTVCFRNSIIQPVNLVHNLGIYAPLFKNVRLVRCYVFESIVLCSPRLHFFFYKNKMYTVMLWNVIRSENI